jgi:hypothetical protein
MFTIEEIYDKLLEEWQDVAPAQKFEFLSAYQSQYHSRYYDLLGIGSKFTGDKLTSLDFITFLSVFAKKNVALEAASKGPKPVGKDRHSLARGNVSLEKGRTISHLRQDLDSLKGRQGAGQPGRLAGPKETPTVGCDEQVSIIESMWKNDPEACRELKKCSLFRQMRIAGMTNIQAFPTVLRAAAHASIGVGAYEGRGYSGDMEMTVFGAIKRNFGSPLARRIFRQAFNGPTGESRGRDFAEAAMSQLSFAQRQFPWVKVTWEEKIKDFMKKLLEIVKSYIS